MKKTIALLTLLLTTAAYADGFRCATLPGDIGITVYNHTQPSEGTRNGAVMILSDRNQESGSRTIATFRDIASTLDNSGARYEANVDLRFKEINKVSSFDIQGLDTVVLDVDYIYSHPVNAGTQLTGRITYTQRNGHSSTEDVICERYLKN